MRATLCLIACSMGVLQGCGSGSGGNPPATSFDPGAIARPTYSSLAQVVFKPACVSCHDGSAGPSLDSYANVIPWVKPGNPAQSPLYGRVSSGEMPLGGPALSAQQVQALHDWIAAGAPDD